MNYKLQDTSYELQTMMCELRVTNYKTTDLSYKYKMQECEVKKQDFYMLHQLSWTIYVIIV
jgi:hypothetical protein